jgi:hypothetical protein
VDFERAIFLIERVLNFIDGVRGVFGSLFLGGIGIAAIVAGRHSGIESAAAGPSLRRAPDATRRQ